MRVKEFFYNAKETLKKQGFKRMLLITLGLCVARGIAVQFIWHEGSFLSGFLYPFIIFAIITVLAFPLYILDKMYGNDKEEETEKLKAPKQKLGVRILISFSKGAGLFLYFVLMLIGFPGLNDIWIEKLAGIFDNYMASYGIFIIYYFFGVYLFFVLVWLYSKNGVFAEPYENKRYKAHFPAKIRRRILAVSVTVFLISYGICSTWYDCVSENGVSKRRVFWTKEYTWENAEYFEPGVNADGTLAFDIGLSDGTEVKLYGGVLGVSSLDEAVYPNDESDFIPYLTEKFVEKGIPAKVKDWDKLEKKIQYDYWKDMLKEIKAIVEK